MAANTGGLTDLDVNTLAIDPAMPTTLYAGTLDYQGGPLAVASWHG